ncbi:MAG: hypothetical protein RMJ59_07085 [Candidatus Nitrosocaldus sp.]|nr:hypothetical protein [Candidatus Nitrosocaldus sp.]MCS7141285.1 hypothetical protein [Candidatus Nitrosocaldus sp.]MDW8000250.1 hypothetical protein [Candidatus Nitrosocaldus sp.]MDW8276122.1 hypothetical protein [Candidatus Nitrosocaldus sp.]
MRRYTIKCRLCDASFMSYGDYERHVVEGHRDNLAYRFRPMVVRDEAEDCESKE